MTSYIYQYRPFVHEKKTYVST